ncbi:SDR family oxidoreductase [Kitasatospora phosalacinea]|uniref:SDR family oxidoreductase n=1 Tax=Kitasatospora phosalacinea TaxID=2065 RepID=UPI0036BA98AA
MNAPHALRVSHAPGARQGSERTHGKGGGRGHEGSRPFTGRAAGRPGYRRYRRHRPEHRRRPGPPRGRGHRHRPGPERGRAAVRRITEAAGRPSGAVRLRIADLGTPGAARRLAEEVLADHPRLHLLVNNAGVNNGTRRTAPDGLEENLAGNAVAPILLTRLLHGRLAAGAEAGRSSRVVLVNTSAHKMVRRAADALGDPQAQAGPYVAMTAYARSKLIALMAGFALARELGDGPVTVTAVDPGPADTGMTRAMDRTFLPPAMRAG